MPQSQNIIRLKRNQGIEGVYLKRRARTKRKSGYNRVSLGIKIN